MAFVAKITDTSATPVTAPVTTALYGTCDTAKSTAAKVVTCADFDKLIVGATIRVKFDNENTASSPTLNVNSTGAKAIRAYGSTAVNSAAIGSWVAGEVVEFIYLEISSTGYWYLTSSHAMFKTGSITTVSATDKSPSKITAWTTNTPTAVTLGTAFSVPNVTNVTDGVAASLSKTDYTLTYSSVTIPNVTAATDVSVPVISSNSSVTSSKLGSDGKGAYVSAASGVISEGVLTLSVTSTTATATTSTNTALGTATTASKVTLGTALSASKITAPTSGTKWTQITAWTTNTPTAVTLGTAFSIPNVTNVTAGTAATLTYETEACSKVTTSTATVVQLR